MIVLVDFRERRSLAAEVSSDHEVCQVFAPCGIIGRGVGHGNNRDIQFL